MPLCTTRDLVKLSLPNSSLCGTVEIPDNSVDTINPVSSPPMPARRYMEENESAAMVPHQR